jgi:hypothetical protein
VIDRLSRLDLDDRLETFAALEGRKHDIRVDGCGPTAHRGGLLRADVYSNLVATFELCLE